jgi:hypothetical protein
LSIALITIYYSVSHRLSQTNTLKSTLKSSKSSAGKADGGESKNKLKIIENIDFGGNTTTTGTINTKQYPPYYFDDNYLGHAGLHHHYCYSNGEKLPPGAMAKDAEGQLFFYHHEPATYLPNYEITKFSTIGLGGEMQYKQPGVPGTMPKYHHASSCNLNQFNSATKSNLIASHNHPFSNSISNFNFNQAFYDPSATVLSGGLGVLPADPYTSNCSLSGGSNKIASWKQRQCPSRGSSSTGSGSSSE